MIENMNIPDVTGFTLGEARKTIESAGMEIKRISMTAPPRLQGNNVDDTCRVVRLRKTDNGKINLTVCQVNIS